METKTEQNEKLSALIVRPSSINLGPSQAIVLNAVWQGYLLHIIAWSEREGERRERKGAGSSAERGEYVMCDKRLPLGLVKRYAG